MMDYYKRNKEEANRVRYARYKQGCLQAGIPPMTRKDFEERWDILTAIPNKTRDLIWFTYEDLK